MNFLQLTQALARECGVPADGLTNTTGQVGELARLVSWIQEATREIGLLHQEWKWLRGDVTFTTSPGVQAYIPVTTAFDPDEIELPFFAAWRRGDMVWRRYITGNPSSENYLEDTDYENFKRYWLFGARRTEQSEPISITVRPSDEALLIGPLPNSVGYTIVGEYYKIPQSLSGSGDDTPEFPSRYHMIIVYLAMMKYGAFEAATEVYQRGEIEYRKMLQALEFSQLEPIQLAGAMV